MPPREGSARAEQPLQRDGLRALVDLTSADGAGPPERFRLPDGPREAAALAAGGTAGVARAAAGPVSQRVTIVAVAAWAVMSLPLLLLAGPAAVALPTVLVGVAWAAAHVVIRIGLHCQADARAGAHCVALYRKDSQRTAHRAAAAAAALLRAEDSDHGAAFDAYHRVLVSLTRYELAAGQAVAADADRARLAPDDPLRAVAGQIAQDHASRAVAHRTAARADVERLHAALATRST